MTASNILEHMKQGAKLHREFELIELTMLDGRRLSVLTDWFDALIDEHRIVAEAGGFHRLT